MGELVKYPYRTVRPDDVTKKTLNYMIKVMLSLDENSDYFP